MCFIKAIINFFKWLISFLVPKQPPRCAVCNYLMKNAEQLWCGNCIYIPCDKIEYNRDKHKFAGVIAGAIYFGDMKKAIWRIKKTPDERTLRFLAFLMRDSINEYLDGVKLDVIVPVPISKEKLKERGFNQSEKLADALTKFIGAPVEPDALIRYDDSEVQHMLSKKSRALNATKSYAAANSDRVKDKTVLLVDDLYTTGATASACANRLLEMGAKSVYVATAVWVPPQKTKSKLPIR